MTGIRDVQAKRGAGRAFLTKALLGVALIGAAAVLYVILHGLYKPSEAVRLKSLARGEMARLEVARHGAAQPQTPFLDAQGRTTRLADLKARVLVVNLWATWCAPCVREMPTLARLQAAYAGRLRVVPISMDAPADREKARAFIGQFPQLPFYQDPKAALPFALSPPAEGFPTTLIYDAAGHEQARLAGGADWSGDDAKAVFDALLARR